TVNVTINATTGAPIAGNTIAYLTGNSGYSSLPLSFSGGTPTSVAVSTASPNGQHSVSGTSILFSPTAGYSGQTTLQYTGTNAGGVSAPGTVTINVAPVVSNVSGMASVGSETSLALYPRTAYDTLQLSVLPSYGRARIVGSNVLYTPNSGTSGLTDTFTYTATSAGGTSTAANISFNIIQGNRPPVANDEIVETYQGVTSTLYPLANDSDPDGDPLTLQSVSPLEFVYGNNGTPSDLGTLTKVGNAVTYTAPFVCNCAARSKYDVIRFSYVVADSHGATSTAKHAINVYSNQPPVANPGTTDPVWQNTNVTLNVLANDTDADGDSLTIKSIDNFYFAYGRINGVDLSGSQHPSDIGSVTNNGASIGYRAPFLSNSGSPGSNYIAVVVWYTATDGRGGTSQSYQIINVYGPQ
ncbi:Ig-like domain-containing protein, partial [Caulobacter sp. SSI4214]|uniref:Ig-like domain-containing protein n=1 Tax=Caulobacter sp. SSI4214 TaxID=2575739 RepID=UPI001F506C93